MKDANGRPIQYVAGWVFEDEYTSDRYRCAHDYGLADSCPMCDAVLDQGEPESSSPHELTGDERHAAIRASQRPGLFDPDRQVFVAVPPVTCRFCGSTRPFVKDGIVPVTHSTVRYTCPDCLGEFDVTPGASSRARTSDAS